MKIYYFETTNPRKVCALAKHLQLPVEYERVDLFKGEHYGEAFAAINPNRKVPVLVDGETTIVESSAIMMHLANAAASDLWPDLPAEQVQVIQWLSWDSAHLSRHASVVYYEHSVRAQASLGPPNLEDVEEAVKFFRRFAGTLDEHLATRPYLVADRLTIADFGVACVMTVARESNLEQLPVLEFPHVCAWLDRLAELAAWRDPWPDD